MMETTMISRMIVNYAFADRTEYSVRTMPTNNYLWAANAMRTAQHRSPKIQLE